MDALHITVGVVLFDGYEPLDVVGPISVFGSVPGIEMVYVAEQVGPVTSVTGTMTVMANQAFADILPPPPPTSAAAGAGPTNNNPQQQKHKLDWLLVPGGIGTRQTIHNEALLGFLQAWVRPGSGLQLCMSVCTGSALLAAAGLLDGVKATSNKVAFDTFITPLRPQVHWVRQARWVHDGMFVTSSGVTAGTDMALYVVKTSVGKAAAAAAASRLEYIPQTDAEGDPFADPHFVPVV